MEIHRNQLDEINQIKQKFTKLYYFDCSDEENKSSTNRSA